jgi:glycerol uptake facilitator-like aquaporin
MKLFLVHTMLFVGSIWKNKSGWFLFVMSLGLLMATGIVLTAGIQHSNFNPSFAQNHHRLTSQNQ